MAATCAEFAAQAISRMAALGWRPLHVLSQVSSSREAVLRPAGFQNAQGMISSNYFKDPTDPNYADDPAVQEFERVMAQYGEGISPGDPSNGYGVAAAQTTVAALERMEEPTRQGLMEAVRSMEQVKIPMLLPGITITLGEGDGYPIESMQLLRFEGEHWVELGEVISYEGRTPVAGSE